MKILSPIRGMINIIESERNWNLYDSGLGKYRGQRSYVLIMVILRVALVTLLLQGLIFQLSGILMSSKVTLFCSIYIIYYGFYAYRIKHKINESNKTC